MTLDPNIDFEYWKRAQDCIAQGALTNSKHPRSHVFGYYPTHVERGSGAHLFTANNRCYVDYICGLGTNLFGYGNAVILDKITYTLNKGFSHSLPTTFEVEAAEALKVMFYFVDKWKFLKTGSEACSAAIRIARVHTGRRVILSQGYHGWSDEFVSLANPGPKGVYTDFDMYDLDQYMKDGEDMKQVAAIIVEPIIADDSDERRAWLLDLRKTCDRHGSLLIFDEVITGFRYLKHSVSVAWNIFPDLICIGKAMAAGLPLAAVGGKKEIMDGDYFVSSTYAGEIFSLAACKEVVNLLLQSNKYNIDKLFEKGLAFIEKFNEMAGEFVRIKGYGTRGVFEGEPTKKAIFFQEASRNGYLFCNSFFYNFPLMEEDYLFFEFLKRFSSSMKLGALKLEGELPFSPFAQKMRDKK